MSWICFMAITRHSSRTERPHKMADTASFSNSLREKTKSVGRRNESLRPRRQIGTVWNKEEERGWVIETVHDKRAFRVFEGNELKRIMLILVLSTCIPPGCYWEVCVTSKYVHTFTSQRFCSPVKDNIAKWARGKSSLKKIPLTMTYQYMFSTKKVCGINWSQYNRFLSLTTVWSLQEGRSHNTCNGGWYGRVVSPGG